MTDYDHGGYLTPGVIRVHPGPPRTGLWCDRCMLPSVVEFDILTDTDQKIGVASSCTDCGPHSGPPPDDEGVLV